MLVYEYKLSGTKQQYVAIDEAIRIVQFIRNKSLRLWMDKAGTSKNDLQTNCVVLVREYPFAKRLNSQARQAAADRAWFAVSMKTVRTRNQGRRAIHATQKYNRSVEYKATGWKLDRDGRHIIITDGCGHRPSQTGWEPQTAC